MIDPRALAALQEAAALIEAEIPEQTPEEVKAEEHARRLAEQERLRRPTPEEAAKAWKERNKEIRRRKSITISTPSEAVSIWLKGVRRRTGGDRPIEPGSRSPRHGETAEEQVIAKVQQTYAVFDYAEGIEAAIEAWPLPMTFYDPVPPLCGVEEELLADALVYEPPPVDDKPNLERRQAEDAHLLSGMRRSDGLHG